MMLIDQFGTGRCQRFFSDKIVQHMAQHINGGALDAGTHSHNPKIRGLRDDSCHQGALEMSRRGLVALNRHDMAAKLRQLIDLYQQLFNPNGG